MKIFKKMKKGFTLVELVVVIAVIAILATVSVGAYFGVTESANRSKLEQEGKQVQTAIQTISLAGNEHSSLTSNGLVLSNPGEFRLALEESLGKEVTLTDELDKKDETKPTIYFTDAAIQSVLGDKTYKSFEYHLPEINGKKSQVDVVTGEVKVVETTAIGEDLPEVLPTVTTISEALTAEVGYPVRISGTVKEVTYTWNGSTMSYKLTDGTNEILVYICKTQVALGDIVTVTGEIGAYNGANQIVKSTAEITGHDDSYDIQTITSIADALTAPLSTEVELIGTVTEINAEYTSATETSFYLTDDSNASIYVFKLPGKVYLNDKVKVIGQIGQYSGVNQVAKGATFKVIERHTCTYSEATCFEPEKCTICDAVKEGSTKLDHTAPNAEGNCERCGNKVDEVSITVNIAEYADLHSWQDKTLYDEIIADENISVTATGTPVGSYGLNTGKYYTNGQNWRIYQNENPSVIITASNGKEITKVQITYTIADTGILTFNGNNVPSNQIVEVNATTATFGVGNTEESVTNGKVQITDFVIYYANASVVEPPHEHNFVNGECECGETDPNYQPSVNPDEPTEGWYLVKDVAELENEDQIIIAAKDKDYAISTLQNTNNRGQAEITKNGEEAILTNDVQLIKIEKYENNFALETSAGYLYAASSSSNHLKTQATLDENGKWSIEITEDGVATIKAQGTNTRNWLRYNSTNNPPIFSCYGSGQSDVAIYKNYGEDAIQTLPVFTSIELKNDQTFSLTTLGQEIDLPELNKVYSNGQKESLDNSLLDWTSSNTQLVSVNNGKIRAEAEGNETVTITGTLIEDNTKTVSFDISVNISSSSGDSGTPDTGLTEKEGTLTFDANKSNRTSFSTTKQVWVQNGVTFTNEKASSQTNIADYGAPVRLYANSKITVSVVGKIKTIVFDCNSSSYATTLGNSIGANATVSGDKVTVNSSDVSEFTVASLTAQVRIDSLTVTYLG